MINIFGVISQNDVVSGLFHGLQQLEADGYASVGITTLNRGHIQQQQTYENPKNWPSLLWEQPKQASFGIAYTVWEKLGKIAPAGHFSRANEHVGLVYDGVIDNYQVLRKELLEQGQQFESQAHSELVIKLLTFYLELGMSAEEIGILMNARLRGNFSGIALLGEETDQLLVVTQGRPLALGIGEKHSLFVTSNANTLGLLSRRVLQVMGGRQPGNLVLDLNNYQTWLTKAKGTKSASRLSSSRFSLQPTVQFQCVTG